MIKRILAVCLCISFVIGLTACEKNDANSKSGSSAGEADTSSVSSESSLESYATFTGYGKRGELLLNDMAKNFWLYNGRLKDQVNKQDYVTLWGYAAYMEACGQRFETEPDNTAAKEEYIKALENVEFFRTGWRSDDLQVYQCWPDTGKAECFYDDNVWVVLEFIHAYNLLGDTKWLDYAKGNINYCYSGWDEKAGGGVYWKEDTRDDPKEASKNTCINAPLALASAELYKVTNDKSYLDWAKKLYTWTKDKFRDPEDNIFWDNVNVATGNVEKSKYSYNTGNMIGAAAVLYEITKDGAYLTDAKAYAGAAYKYFGFPTDETEEKYFYRMKEDNPWFNSSLLKGYMLLYAADPAEVRYIDSFLLALAYACEVEPDSRGYMNSSWKGGKIVMSPDALNQSGTGRVLYMLQSFVNKNPEHKATLIEASDET